MFNPDLKRVYWGKSANNYPTVQATESKVKSSFQKGHQTRFENFLQIVPLKDK